MRTLSRSLLLQIVAAVLLLAAGCEVTTVVSVDVDDDGSGEVEVLLGLDAEAVARLPDLDGSGVPDEADLVELVRTDDLEAADWSMAGPRTEDGTTWLRATKPFGTPEEATAVLAELTGPDGALPDLEVRRESSFGRDRFELTGTADLSDGLEAFGDEGLAAALDGEPLGESPEDIEERFGTPVEEMYRLHIRALLPGDDAAWTPALGGPPVTMEAGSTVYDVPVLVLVALSALALAGLVAVFVVRTLRSARS